MSITLQRLTKSFGNATVVDDLSLEIQDGEFLVLLGPSGCGKTTTLRMIAGLEHATSGEILIDGRHVNNLAPQKRDVAMVFQSYALYPHMTVAENISYPLRVRNLDRVEIERQVTQSAQMLEIELLLPRRPRELSGGERQRVALARAIVRHPRAFLMDEPLSNLDAKLRLQMRAELKRLQQKLETTTVYVTHDQAEAMTLGHRVAVMHKGQLQQLGTPLDIYHRPANRFVGEFVGTPGMNFIDGQIDDDMFSARDLKLLIGSDQLNELGGRGQLTFGIRPEDVHVTISPREGAMPARIYITELMGSETLAFVEVGKTRVVARAPADFRGEVNSKVWVAFDMAKAHFFDSRSGKRL